MALTPDDVVNKVFAHVRFKDGFDPDEVDDYLDEVVKEWRKTLEENDALKAKVAELEAQVASLESGAEAAPAADIASPAPIAAPAPIETPAESSTPAQSAGIIELAQRLHDEHVAEGKTQRDQLISEAQSQAARIVSDAEARGRAESERLEQQRQELEGRISELRSFERDYRTNLRSYIEGQLADLDQSSASAPAND